MILLKNEPDTFLILFQTPKKKGLARKAKPKSNHKYLPQ